MGGGQAAATAAARPGTEGAGMQKPLSALVKSGLLLWRRAGLA